MQSHAIPPVGRSPAMARRLDAAAKAPASDAASPRSVRDVLSLSPQARKVVENNARTGELADIGRIDLSELEPVDLGPARRIDLKFNGMSIKEMGKHFEEMEEEIRKDFEEIVKYMKKRELYADAVKAFYDDLSKKFNFGWERLNRLSGGLLSHDVAFSIGPSGITNITTSSGAPHPKADQIRSFLKEHMDEYRQLAAPTPQFMSFDEWSAKNAQGDLQ